MEAGPVFNVAIGFHKEESPSFWSTKDRHCANPCVLFYADNECFNVLEVSTINKCPVADVIKCASRFLLPQNNPVRVQPRLNPEHRGELLCIGGNGGASCRILSD